jgi:hypothetical protein
MLELIKKRYTQPILKEHGIVRELTQSGSGGKPPRSKRKRKRRRWWR